jgi:hypothetical protein
MRLHETKRAVVQQRIPHRDPDIKWPRLVHRRQKREKRQDLTGETGVALCGQGYPGLQLNGTKSVPDLTFVEERAE